MNSALKIVEINSEIGAGTRGSSTGIQAIKTAAYNNNDISKFKKFKRAILENRNEALYEGQNTPNAKYIEPYAKHFKYVCEEVKEIAQNSEKLIFLTGDHSNAAAIIKGIRKARPTKKIGVIWIDAHADLHTPYTTPSGNIHGMPLAVALKTDNLDKKRNAPDEITKKLWEDFKELDTNIQDIELAFIGLRDTEPEENYLIEKHNIPVYTVKQVAENMTDNVVNPIKKQLENCDEVYISFDVDSMDPDLVSYGTGTPVKGGLSLEDADKLVSRLLETIKTVKTFEITEVNPTLDNKCNRMAEAANQILNTAIKFLNQ